MNKSRKDWSIIAITWLITSVMVFGIPYLAMLVLGVAHKEDDRIPAFGYLTTFLVSFALQLMTGAIKK